MLDALGLAFTVVPRDVDETIMPGESPAAAAERLARAKADLPGGWVIGADTIVALDGTIFGKPIDPAEAWWMLRALRGRDHTVTTGVAVRSPAGKIVSATDTARVTMRHYRDDEIDRYIASGDPFDKAGSYAIQHPEFRPVAQVEGDPETVIGLPSRLVRELLAAAGYDPAPPGPSKR